MLPTRQGPDIKFLAIIRPTVFVSGQLPTFAGYGEFDIKPYTGYLLIIHPDTGYQIHFYINHGTHIKLRNRCARKEQFMLLNLFKAFD